MTIGQRRKLGLTFRNVLRTTRALRNDGKLEGLAREEIAVVVLTSIVEQRPQAYADPMLDWDALLAFIERLLPLILKIIEMFSTQTLDAMCVELPQDGGYVTVHGSIDETPAVSA